MAEERELIRVLLADGHALFREATRVLQGEGDIVVVGDGSDGSAAIADVERTRPHCVFVDDEPSAIDGAEATRRIKDRLPECDVILLASEADEAMLVASIEAGASGYLAEGSPSWNSSTRFGPSTEVRWSFRPRCCGRWCWA